MHWEELELQSSVMKTPWQRATPVMFCLQVGLSEFLAIEKGPGALSTEAVKCNLKDWDEDVSYLLFTAAFQSEPQSTFVKLKMKIFIC